MNIRETLKKLKPTANMSDAEVRALLGQIKSTNPDRPSNLTIILAQQMSVDEFEGMLHEALELSEVVKTKREMCILAMLATICITFMRNHPVNLSMMGYEAKMTTLAERMNKHMAREKTKPYEQATIIEREQHGMKTVEIDLNGGRPQNQAQHSLSKAQQQPKGERTYTYGHWRWHDSMIDRAVDMVNNTDQWPMKMRLPLKRYRDEDGKEVRQLGYLVANAGYKVLLEEVRHGDPDIDDFIQYDSAEAIFANQWEID